MPLKEADSITIELKVDIAGKPIALSLTIPSAVIRPRVMLPVIQQVTDAMVLRAEQQMAEQGKTVSCSKGCWACCRHLVPVTEIEAYQLSELIGRLPPERRDAVRARFDAIRVRLASEGMLTALEAPENIAESELAELSDRFFSLHIACPFLDEESCSIHSDRPMVCREYLVTSPARYCSELNSDRIDRVPLPGAVSSAVSALGAKPGQRLARWVPLITAPQWASTHPEPPASRTGPEILHEVFGRLWGKPTVGPAA